MVQPLFNLAMNNASTAMTLGIRTNMPFVQLRNWGCSPKEGFQKGPNLRIPAIHGAKTTKNQTPLVRFAWSFYNQTVFQKFERPFFDQVVIDAKNV